MKKLVLAAVVMLFSTTTMAEPSGSLKAMLDTNITLIEYLDLKIGVESLRRQVTGRKTVWFANSTRYESVVEIHINFDYDESKLYWQYQPVDHPIFKTTKAAKEYCRALQKVEVENRSVLVLTSLGTSPLGWGNSKTNTKGYYEGIYANSVLRTIVFPENIEDSSELLVCRASLNKDMEIASWSFNI